MSLAQLPLGNSSFARLRRDREIYVDKTDLVYRLACKTSGTYFLARPRRFGKSLLLSTFESLFRYGLHDFSGLAIEKLWQENKTHPVLRLDFANCQNAKNEEELSRAFSLMLANSCDRAGIAKPHQEDPLRQFSQILLHNADVGLVLLIDEYDAPLTHHIHEPEIFALHQNFLEDFFSLVKTWNEALRFVFMTGITKFSHSGIFTVLNSMSDISLDPAFGTLLGYTEEEIERYFAGYLERAAYELQLSHPALMSRLREQYDGYCFSEDGDSRVYTPWSVLSFLDNPQRGFVDYWYKSGGQPAALLNYLTNHQLADPSTFFQEKVVDVDDLDASQEYAQMNQDTLLLQTGYLTIGHVEENWAYLRYPNREVEHALAKLFTRRLMDGVLLPSFGITTVAKVFITAQPHKVIDLFNRILTGLSYGDNHFTRESQVRDALALVLLGADMDPQSEVHNQYGRSDLEVKTPKVHWVFELKFAREDEKTQPLLQEAVRQICERHYGEADISQRQLIRIALVYSQEKKQITAWKVAL